MPFRDHSRPPMSKRHSWDEVHGGWPMMIVQKLPPLPVGYHAPRVQLGSYHHSQPQFVCAAPRSF